MNRSDTLSSIIKKTNSSLTNIKKNVSINEINDVNEYQYYTLKDYDDFENRDDNDDPRKYITKRNSINTILQNNEPPNSRQTSYSELMKTPSNQSLDNANEGNNGRVHKIKEIVEIILPETRIFKQVDPVSKFYKLPIHHPRITLEFHNKVYPGSKEIMNVKLINPVDCKVLWKLIQCTIGTVNYDPNNDEHHEYQYSFNELFSCFSFNKLNGSVEPFESEKLLLTFKPPVPGEYNQQWYIQCKKTKIVLEIKGYCKPKFEKKKRPIKIEKEYYNSEYSFSSSSSEEDIYSDLPYIPINIYKYDDLDDMKNESISRINEKLSIISLSSDESEDNGFFKNYGKQSENETNNFDDSIYNEKRSIDNENKDKNIKSDDDNNNNIYPKYTKINKLNKSKNNENKKKKKNENKTKYNPNNVDDSKEILSDDDFNNENLSGLSNSDSKILNKIDSSLSSNSNIDIDMDNSIEQRNKGIIFDSSDSNCNYDPNNKDCLCNNDNYNNNSISMFSSDFYYPNNRFNPNNINPRFEPNYAYNQNYKFNPYHNFDPNYIYNPNNKFNPYYNPNSIYDPKNNFNPNYIFDPNNKSNSNYKFYPDNTFNPNNRFDSNRKLNPRNQTNNNNINNNQYKSNKENIPNNQFELINNNKDHYANIDELPYSKNYYDNNDHLNNNNSQEYINSYFPLVKNINDNVLNSITDKNIYVNANCCDKKPNSSKEIVNNNNDDDINMENKDKIINETNKNKKKSSLKEDHNKKMKNNKKKGESKIKKNNKEKNQILQNKSNSNKEKYKLIKNVKKKEKIKTTKYRKRHRNRKRSYSISSSSSTSISDTYSYSNETESYSSTINSSLSTSSSHYNKSKSSTQSITFSICSNDVLNERSSNIEYNESNDSSEYSIEYSNNISESFDKTSDFQSKRSSSINNLMSNNNFSSRSRILYSNNEKKETKEKESSNNSYCLMKSNSLSSLKCHAPLSPMSSNLNDSLSYLRVNNKSNVSKCNEQINSKNIPNIIYESRHYENSGDNGNGSPYNSPNQANIDNSYLDKYSKQDLYNLIKDPYYHQFVHTNRSDYSENISSNNSLYSYKNNSSIQGNSTIENNKIQHKNKINYVNEKTDGIENPTNICDKITETIQSVYNDDNIKNINIYKRKKNCYSNNNNDIRSNISRIKILNNNIIKDHSDSSTNFNDITYKKEENTYVGSNNYTHRFNNDNKYNYHHNIRSNINNNNIYNKEKEKINYNSHKKYSNSRTYSISSKYNGSDFTSNSSKDILLKSHNEGQIQQFITSKLNQMLSDNSNGKIYQ
ncbi:hypothetical protein BCR36DRAFT_410565 [Piromyces finnis]|uniref:Cep192-like domain-containing protein n=1 Tax=Piromyces finnis TaxID=1754191 RepID=A0A1Y1VFC9_9FUNG|nr:hypothetical protein BCR36DRAFT_410565 [Piromyces finnis]|eukprot:ORX54758.1 hypothetical protein BCR36DRAFT_410565 [Piromyces finnis]